MMVSAVWPTCISLARLGEGINRYGPSAQCSATGLPSRGFAQRPGRQIGCEPLAVLEEVDKPGHGIGPHLRRPRARPSAAYQLGCQPGRAASIARGLARVIARLLGEIAWPYHGRFRPEWRLNVVRQYALGLEGC